MQYRYQQIHQRYLEKNKNMDSTENASAVSGGGALSIKPFPTWPADESHSDNNNNNNNDYGKYHVNNNNSTFLQDSYSDIWMKHNLGIVQQLGNRFRNDSFDLLNTMNATWNLTDIAFRRPPKEILFTDDNLVSVIAYSCLFIVGAVGNLTVFITLFRNRGRKSRVNLFILHLSMADLIVVLIMIPLDTVWHITVSWRAGEPACRILMFFRAFGFYLSSFILVVISLDRYFAILHPLSLNDADRRGRIMLAFAWSLSIIASIPQSVIFHVERHPDYVWHTQCVTFNFFPSERHELAYNLFNALTVYAVPLCVISAAYTAIIYKITKKTRESRAEIGADADQVRWKLRRSAVGNIEKARIRTLKMTLVIVLVFVVCWTPYFLMIAWWCFDRDSYANVNPKVQRGLLLFAVSNSCVNPLVYGMFTLNFWQEFRRCCACLRRPGWRPRDQRYYIQCSPHRLSSVRVASERSVAVGAQSRSRSSYSSDNCQVNALVNRSSVRASAAPVPSIRTYYHSAESLPANTVSRSTSTGNSCASAHRVQEAAPESIGGDGRVNRNNFVRP